MNLNPSDILEKADQNDSLLFYRVVYDGFEQAAQRAGRIERFYSVGGYAICLRFAGPGLIPYLAPALDHLEASPCATPDLTVCLWDSTSTGTKMPLLASVFIDLFTERWFECLDRRKEVRAFNSERIPTLFHIGPNILSMLDTQNNVGLYWLKDMSQIPYWESGSPLQAILSWWTSGRELQYVHAGAVGTPAGGVLLAGKGGSGKSTVSLACLNSELAYAGDDYCLVSLESIPRAYSLYNTAKLTGLEDLQRFPHLASLIANRNRGDEEKLLIFLHQYCPQKILRSFPVRAILLPRVTVRSDVFLMQTTSMAALKALAPSTLFQLSRTGQTTLQFLSQLVKRVPCYTLELGADIAQIPGIILDLLTEP